MVAVLIIEFGIKILVIVFKELGVKFFVFKLCFSFDIDKIVFVFGLRVIVYIFFEYLVFLFFSLELK